MRVHVGEVVTIAEYRNIRSVLFSIRLRILKKRLYMRVGW